VNIYQICRICIYIYSLFVGFMVSKQGTPHLYFFNRKIELYWHSEMGIAVMPCSKMREVCLALVLYLLSGIRIGELESWCFEELLLLMSVNCLFLQFIAVCDIFWECEWEWILQKNLIVFFPCIYRENNVVLCLDLLPAHYSWWRSRPISLISSVVYK